MTENLKKTEPVGEPGENPPEDKVKAAQKESEGKTFQSRKGVEVHK